jgi:DNA-binding MarR family transcriptional regulator
MRIIYYNVIVDVFLSRLGVSIVEPSADRVLIVLKKQDPKDPWVDIKQIIEKTGLKYSVVNRNLTSLLEAGLVVEYPRSKNTGQCRYFADALKEIEGMPPNRTTRKVLGVVTEQNRENPWVDIQSIIEKTGLKYSVVNRILPRLLKAGLVVEYPRKSKRHSRYFADSLKQIEGIKPLNRTTRKVLSMLGEQNPRNPWVDIQSIIKETGLTYNEVYRKLTSLLAAGLVVEYPRQSKGQRRYFADAKQVEEGVIPPNEILDMLKEQNPEAPWVDIQSIIDETGLKYSVVNRNLTSLLKAGLVVEYPRPRESTTQCRYFADASIPVEGIQPLDRYTRKVLGAVTEKNPRNPWVSIRQIIEKTGLSSSTVFINLTSLLEAGLVVEYPREYERQRRYFADTLIGQQEAVLVVFSKVLKRGLLWLKLDQIGELDHQFRQNLQNLQRNQLSDLLERLIQEKLVRSKVEGQHKYYALTPEGIQSAQTVNEPSGLQG